MTYGVPSVGSPPRMRGKDFKSFLHMRFLRITPACAGKRQRKHGVYSFDGDHPRVCGEKLESVYQVAAVPGSPPRMRGKAASSAPVSASSGITPACAGKR